jgi:putative transcriptional regulator
VKARIINHVKEYRVKRGMTQEELARVAGVSRQSIISIERGRYVPSLQLALRLSRLFTCSTDDLFQLEKEG